ncbi:MAG TPA: hypothetical protein VMG39_02745 [Pseudolabrys sp.]|nr:hypothetical protein [Pseudolabrys sp.]
MLNAAFIVLVVAGLFGSGLAVPYLREGPAPPWPIGAAHGLIALTGLALLALTLRGPPRGVAQGIGSFGAIAAVLLALAALAGLVQFALRLRRRRLPGALLGAHATLAIGGFIILLVYVLG